jgi:hypothetical protein
MSTRIALPLCKAKEAAIGPLLGSKGYGKIFIIIPGVTVFLSKKESVQSWFCFCEKPTDLGQR